MQIIVCMEKQWTTDTFSKEKQNKTNEINIAPALVDISAFQDNSSNEAQTLRIVN